MAAHDVVVLPAHVEHQPRLLLRALALGMPVIATRACGLPEQVGLTLVDSAAELKSALQNLVAPPKKTTIATTR